MFFHVFSWLTLMPFPQVTGASGASIRSWEVLAGNADVSSSMAAVERFIVFGPKRRKKNYPRVNDHTIISNGHKISKWEYEKIWKPMMMMMMILHRTPAMYVVIRKLIGV